MLATRALLQGGVLVEACLTWHTFVFLNLGVPVECVGWLDTGWRGLSWVCMRDVIEKEEFAGSDAWL